MQRRNLISLNGSQLRLVMVAASGLDIGKRDAFLERVAAQLMRQARRVTDDDVGRAVEMSLRSLLMSAA